jgi:predicted phosphodiesterase
MKIVIISDTHGMHPWLKMPEGDVLVHAGDWCQDYGSLDEMMRFADWIAEQAYDAKVVIGGNHDFPAQDNNARCHEHFRKLGVHYLQDSGVRIAGAMFWGAPWQPEFGNMAFGLPRGGALWDKWRRIPQDVDVLITHGPPHGILDNAVPPEDLFSQDRLVGCEQLLRRVRQIKPKLHCFGHIHASRGREEIDGTCFINAANAGSYMAMGSKLSAELIEETKFRRDPMVYDLEVSC